MLGDLLMLDKSRRAGVGDLIKLTRKMKHRSARAVPLMTTHFRGINEREGGCKALIMMKDLCVQWDICYLTVALTTS
jgi:hypothetical protein